MELYGVYWNTIQWQYNRVEWNETKWNKVNYNTMKLNGIKHFIEITNRGINKMILNKIGWHELNKTEYKKMG